jgi:acetylglutamate kinase
MMQNSENRDIIVAALKHAAPDIRMFKRKIFVLKAGGEVFENSESTRHLIEQIAILHQVGIGVILVHGGGRQSTELAEELGINSQFVGGRRVTDERSLQVSAMILNGKINTEILAACREKDLPAIGISGVDAGLIDAHRRPPVKVEGHETGLVDYGFVGDIDSVDAAVLRTQIDSGLMPVVSPLSADASGTLLNINADTVAAAIASAVGAEKLILITGAPGILEDSQDPGTLVSYIDLSGLHNLRDGGSLAAGMLPKASAIESAIKGGVPRVHIISFKLPDTLLLEIFTNEGTGTLVVGNINTLSAEEQSPGSKI